MKTLLALLLITLPLGAQTTIQGGTIISGGPAVQSLNGVSGAANITTATPGTVTITPNVGAGTIQLDVAGSSSSVTNINGTSGAFTFTGAGVNCIGVTCTFSGGGSGGLTTLSNDLLSNGPSGAIDLFNFYPTIAYSPTTALGVASTNGGLITLSPAVVGTLSAGAQTFTNPNNVIVDDLGHQSAKVVPFTAYGAQCDIRQGAVTVIQGSTTVSILMDFFYPYDVGKTFVIAGAISGVPTQFDSVIASVTGARSATATLTTAVPLPSGTYAVYLAHDDTAAFQQGFNVNSSNVPPFGDGTGPYRSNTVALDVPTGGCMVHQLTYTGVGILGHGGGSNIHGLPGEHILAFPNPSVATAASAAGVVLQNFTMTVDNQIDATKPWQLINDSGTTAKAAMYNPAGIYSPAANNPIASGWFQGSGPNLSGAIASVATVVAGTATITVPATLPLPVSTQKVVFPYLASVFTTTVSSVNTGTRVVTLAANMPTGSTGSQVEFWAGTSPQSLATGFSSGACPSTVTLNNSIVPAPNAPDSNVATYGMFKIDAEEFTYSGRTNAGGGPPSSYIFSNIQCGQNGTSRAAHSTNATVVPLNQFSPSTPWPVVPTINSGSGTPAGAKYYPGFNVGNSAIWAGVSDGNAGTAPESFVNSVVQNILINTGPVSNTINKTAPFYLVSLPYSTQFRNITVLGTQYGPMEGVPAVNAGGTWQSTQPTGDGTSWDGIRLSVCNVFDFVAGSQNTLSNFNTYSSCFAADNSTGVGAHTAWYFTAGMNDWTGTALSVPAKWQLYNMYNESETGADYGRDVQYALGGADFLWHDMHLGSGGEIWAHGSNQHWLGGNFNQQANFPLIDWGTGNSADYGSTLGNNVVGNTYGTNTLIEYGQNANWLGTVNQAGGTPSGPFGPNALGNNRQPIPNQTNETWNTGNVTAPYVSSDGGYIPASEFGQSAAYESQPFQVPWRFDSTAPSGGSVGCTTTTSGIQCFDFRQNNGGISVGTGERIVAGKYRLFLAVEAATATSFNLQVGVCAAGDSLNTTISGVTTSWTVKEVDVDLTGKGTCGGGVAIGVGASNVGDTIFFSYLDFSPVSQSIETQNLIITSLGGVSTSPVCPNGTGGALTISGCTGGSSSGFPITLGSTSVTSGSTTTTLAGLTLTGAVVNGVTLTTGGSSATFLNGAGSYATPAGTGPHVVCSGTQSLGTPTITSGSKTNVTITCTGATVNDSPEVNFNGGTDPTTITGFLPSTAGTLSIFKWASTNTINVTIENNTAGSITLGATTVNYRDTQ